MRGKRKTKKEAVATALNKDAKARRRLGILSWVDKVEYWPDYDHKKLRRRKPRLK